MINQQYKYQYAASIDTSKPTTVSMTFDMSKFKTVIRRKPRNARQWKKLCKQSALVKCIGKNVVSYQ